MQNSEFVQYMKRECYDLQNMVGGGVIFAKYGGVEVRFAIYPSEKHLELVSTDFENFWRFDFQIFCRLDLQSFCRFDHQNFSRFYVEDFCSFMKATRD